MSEIEGDEMDLAGVPGFDCVVNGPRKEIDRLLASLAQAESTIAAERLKTIEECARQCDAEEADWREGHSSKYGEQGARDCAARIRNLASVDADGD